MICEQKKVGGRWSNHLRLQQKQQDKQVCEDDTTNRDFWAQDYTCTQIEYSTESTQYRSTAVTTTT